MKQAEPKNGVWDSTCSQLVAALSDGWNRRLVSVGLLGMVLDLLVFQALYALTADVTLAQIPSFLVGAFAIFALGPDGILSAPNQPGKAERWTLYGRFVLVSLLALLLRSAVFSLLMRNWHWEPR